MSIPGLVMMIFFTVGKLYEDPKRWSFQFQSYVQLTRFDLVDFIQWFDGFLPFGLFCNVLCVSKLG
jgi:hypothetical protein